MMNSHDPAPPPGPLKRLLNPSEPFCREDVLWALDRIKRKAAEGAPEWSGLDRPQIIDYFVRYAEMALLLLHRQTPGSPETRRFREMVGDLLSGPR